MLPHICSGMMILPSLVNTHGWLALDKPVGLSSQQAVNRLKRKFPELRKTKIGFLGTLDPLASGMLPIAIGKATKLMDYAHKERKTYQFCIAWGCETTTDDLEGEVTHTSPHRPQLEDWHKLAHQFIGHIQQVPPQYSAKKIAGQRAYHMARQGKNITLPACQVVIYELKCLEWHMAYAYFEVVCGKGTYVRSLARDIARALGTYGHITHLRRTNCGFFLENMLIPLEVFEKMSDIKELYEKLHPIAGVVDDMPKWHLERIQAIRFLQGQKLEVNQQSASVPERNGQVIALYYKGNILALGQVIDHYVKPLCTLVDVPVFLQEHNF